MKKIFFFVLFVIGFLSSGAQAIQYTGSTTLCQGQSLSLSIPVPPLGTTLQWTKNNSPIPGSTSASLVVTQTGNYSVVATTGSNNVYYDTVTVTVNPNPVAAFTFSPNNICISTPVSFTNNSTGSGLSYSWNFGDAASSDNSSMLANPVHRFIGVPGTAPQTFKVKLTTTNNTGCNHTDSMNVIVNQSPGTQLSGTGFTSPNTFKSCGTSATNFTFINQSSTISTNTAYSILWGDGSPNFVTTLATNWTTTHSFGVGSHPIKFTVTGTNGCTDTATYYVFVGTNPAVALGNPGNTAICSGDSLVFPISNINSNSPGTVYTVSFNDGYSVSYIHPNPPAAPPSSVSHIFNTTSCGTNSSNGLTTFNNSFSAIITASNPCGTSSGSVVPIYVSQKPQASMTVSPNDTVCVNSSVTITSTSPLNNSVDPGNGTCTPGKNVWTISPSTGFTITSGSLGNTFGFGDPAIWANGTNTLVLNFTSTGQYIIKLITGNNVNCQLDTAIRTICVNPQPVAGFNLSTAAGCSPLNVGVTNTSNSPICGTNTYMWSVSYSNAQSCTPNSSNYTVTSGNLTSFEPAFQFINAGVYTIRLVTRNSSGACISAAVMKTVTVKSKPTVTIPPISSICQNGSITPTATVNNCYSSTPATYAWSFEDGLPATSMSLNPGSIIMPVAGNKNIQLEATNECGTTTSNVVVQIRPNPVITVPSNIEVCAGATVGPLNFSSSVVPATYTWTNSAPSIGLSANGTTNPIAAFTSTNNTASSISSTINVTGTSSSCSGQTSFTIAINPKPVIDTRTASICSGSSFSITLSNNPPAIVIPSGTTYTWGVPVSNPVGAVTGGSAQSNQSAISQTLSNNTNAPATLTYTVTPISGAAGNCVGSTFTVTVTVNPQPSVAGTSFVNPSICGGSNGSISLTGLAAVTSYTVTYLWNGSPVVRTLVSDGAGTVVITGLTQGSYTNIFVAFAGCSSGSSGPITLVDPSAPATPSITSNDPICSGSNLTLSASTITPGAVTYAWTGPNGFVSTQSNLTRPNVTTDHAGTYTVTATLNGCTSAAGSINVVVNQTPLNIIASNSGPVCDGSAVTLQATSTTPLTTFSWTGPNGYVSNLPSPFIVSASSTNAGTYSVVATLGNCPSVPVTTTITVNPIPVISGSSSVNPTSCNTSTGFITLTGLAASTTYNVSYSRNGAPPSTIVITSTATGSVMISSLGAGSYDNVMVSVNGCPSNAVGPFVLADPNPPVMPVAGNNGPICSGNALSLNASTISAGTATYAWTGPNNFNSALQSPTITNATVAASGTYTVTATINGCTSVGGTTTVVINQTPATPTVSSNSPVCTGNALTLGSSTSTPGIMTYAWTGPNGFTSMDQNPTISNATIAAGGTYTVMITAATGNCPSAIASIGVVVNATPAISTTASTNPTSCATPTGTITLNGLTPTTSYTVSYVKNAAPVTATISSNAAGSVVITNLTAGTYSDIGVAVSGCPSNLVGPITLTDPNPPVAPTVGSNSPVCSGATLNLTASTSTPGAVTYAWTSPNGFTSGLQNPAVLNVPVSASGTYFVTATLNNCVSLPASVLVEVQPLPVAPSVTTPVNYCIGATAVPLTATAAVGNTLQWYTAAIGGVASPVAPTPSTAIAGTTGYYVSQKNPLGCEGQRAQINVVINPDARALFNYAADTSCAPFTINASVIQPVLFPDRNNVYEWYADGNLIGSGTTFPGFVLTQAGDSVTIKLRVTSLFGCKEDSMKHEFFTRIVPIPTFNVNTLEGCGPLSVQVTNTTPQSGLFNFFWNFGNGQTSLLVNPPSITYQPNPTYNDTTYTITLSAISVCDTVRTTKIIRVKSKPKATFTPDKTFGCSPMTVVFANQSLGLGITYTWDFGDGSPQVITGVRGPQTHTYHTAVRDTFHARLIAVNDCGADTMQFNIVVSPNQIALDLAVNGNQVFGCAPHAVNFFNNSAGATSFFWNFGDGNTLTTTNNIGVVNHTFQNPGTYVVTLRATNGCSDTTTAETITVFPRSTASFTLNRSIFCLGDTLRTTNTSVDATRYEWEFGDGGTSTAVAPIHIYSVPGSYMVTLRTYRLNPQGNECSNSSTQSVMVVATATGSFTATPDNGICAPLTVSFANQNLPSVTANWNFGDGNTGTGNTISHTYLTPGNYTVTLATLVPGGCTYVATKNIIITGPAGQLQYTSGFLCDGQSARFEVIATNTDSVTWNFGDGTSITTSQRIVFHTYQNPGAYLPFVTLNSNTGCRFPVRGIDSIKVDRMTKGYTAIQQRLCGATVVNYTDTSSVFYGKALVRWEFGDNTTGIGGNVSHTYSISGNYRVLMIVRSNSGCIDTTDRMVNIVVNSIPVATIVGPAAGCAGQPMTFTGNIQSSDAVNFVKWTTSTGVTGNVNPINFSFALPGTYTVQLIVGTVNGCFDTTDFHNILINPTPTIIASNDLTLCRGGSGIITATGGLQYNWTPIQGLSCTTCPSPLASPLVSTRYKVEGTNAFGCSAFDSVDITVIQPFDITVSPNDSICVGSSSKLLASGATSYIWTGPNLSSTTVSNPIATPLLTTSYRVVGYDGFNCFTDTAFVTVAVGEYPTVSLGPDLTLATGTVRPMTSVITNGPIRNWLWKPATDLSCTTCALPSATIKKDISYIVTVTTAYGCSASDTLSIKAFCDNVQTFVPNAFTPDGDGINDILMVRGSGIAQVKTFRIFNRWGEVVFERGNFSANNPAFGWDGKVKGVVGPPDVYVYTAEVICENGTSYTYKGNVSVLK